MRTRCQAHILWSTMFCLSCLLMGLWAAPAAAASKAKVDKGIVGLTLGIIQLGGTTLTVAGTSERVGSPLILWPCRPTATFVFKHLGNNIYTIRTNSTMIDAQNGRVGSPIVLRPPNNSRAQQWKVVKAGPYVSLINVSTGLALELIDNKRVPKTRYRLARPDGSVAQQLEIISPSLACDRRPEKRPPSPQQQPQKPQKPQQPQKPGSSDPRDFDSPGDRDSMDGQDDSMKSIVSSPR